MVDLIQLLPDAIANQIAAGEVVQRPASVVKELMENSIDAGARKITLILKLAGKQLIQVIDDGCGMSGTDARMSFERHATSKLRTAHDLFAIKTLGFRGEALASIAAVAQVELKTRMHGEDLGSRIHIEGSQVILQEACEAQEGTNFLVKNLFFNVPARRKFLKSDTVELRHILDEFQRIALAHPDLHFEAFHNGNEIYHLSTGNLRKRIVGLFGKNFNDRLVPIEEDTDMCQIGGFIGKPESAKRRRGQQFLMVNGRFIKSPYLNHAVTSAYQNILADGAHPFYVLFLKLDPARIDVNIHPTKQEIKFEDEKIIYNMIKATVRHALNQFNITPSLDFDQSPIISQTGSGLSPSVEKHKVIIPSSFSKPGGDEAWENLYSGLERETVTAQPSELENPLDEAEGKAPYQIHQSFIISQIASGFVLVDQQRAHERILFEKFIANLAGQSAGVQRLLFPKTLELPRDQVTILQAHLDEIQAFGFDLEHFGDETYLLHGVPAHLAHLDQAENLVVDLLEQFVSNLDLELKAEQKLALSLAQKSARPRGTTLSVEEMRSLIDQLFACESPFYSPTGKKCVLTFDLNELQEKMNA